MKKAIFILMLIGTAFGVSAQQVWWGNPIKDLSTIPETIALGDDSTFNVFAINGKRNFGSFRQYDLELNELNFKEFQFDKKRKMEYVTNVSCASGKMFLMLKEYNSDNKGHDFFSLEIDKQGNILSDLKYLFSVDGNKKKELDIKVYYSPDRTKMAVIINDKDFKSFDNYSDFVSYISVFEGDLQVLYKKKYEMPDLASKVENYGNWLSNDGSLLYYYRMDKSGSGTFARSGNYANKFLLIAPTGKTVKELTIEDVGLYYLDFKVYQQDSVFQVGSLLSMNENRKSIHGVSVFSIKNSDGNFQSKRIIYFNDYFYNRIYRNEVVDKAKEGGLERNYQLLDFKYMPNGNIVFLCEKFTVEAQYINTPRFGMYGYYTPQEVVYNYNWGNILAFGINPKDSILWTDIYLKRQVAQSRNYFSSFDFYNHLVSAFEIPVSFFARFTDYEMQVVFDDEAKNYELQMSDANAAEKKISILNNYSKANTYLYTIDLASGNEVIEEMQSAEKTGMVIYPKFCRSLDKDNIIIIGRGANDYRIGKIGFTD